MKNMNATEGSVSSLDLASCQKILARIQETRDAVMTQFRDLINDRDQALRLALNEAEALAWQTPAPHLVFPDLAEEKARALAAWSQRQHALLAAA